MLDDLLARFATNHERTGVPRNAASAHEASGDFDLARMRRLLRALGDPHERYPVVHVAGTKGKGSVVSLLAGVLRAAGGNVGTYKSPHVHSASERIVCGEGTRTSARADRAEAKRVPRDVARVLESARLAERGALTRFEALTALAFSRFARASVDAAVVEVGVGGELDATNVFSPDTLAAAIITPIGKDHWDALGGSLGAVVAAKCGVVKPHRPAFVADLRGEEEEDDDDEDEEEKGEKATIRAVALGEATARRARLVGEWEVRVRCVLRRVEWREEEDDEDGAEEASAEASASTSATPSASRLPLPRQVVDLTIDASLGGVAGHPRSRVVRGVALALMGPHQRRNAELAVAALEFLRLGGGLGARDGDLRAPPNPSSVWSFDDAALRRGLESARSPGCFELIAAEKNENARDEEEWRLVADGAHTRASAAALFRTLDEAFPRADWPRLAIVVASASDKDHEGVLREVYRAAPDAVVLCRVAVAGGSERSTSVATLAAAAKRAEKKARNRRGGAGGRRAAATTTTTTEATVGEAIDAARAAIGEGEGGAGVVLVAGSLNVVPEARAWAREERATRRGEGGGESGP